MSLELKHKIYIIKKRLVLDNLLIMYTNIIFNFLPIIDTV